MTTQSYPTAGAFPNRGRSKKTDVTNRILNVAERLFVDRGFDAVSVRDITKSAKVNVASVNYHFGSKDALCAAVLIRLFGPLLERRQDRLGGLKEQSRTSGKPISLPALVGSWLDPFFEKYYSTPGWGAATYALEDQLLKSPEIERSLAEKAPGRTYREDFISEINKTCTHLSRAEAEFRYWSMVGLVTASHKLPNWYAQNEASFARKGRSNWLRKQTREAAIALFQK